MELLEEDKTPLSLHEDIINYLKDQDFLGAEDADFYQNITNFTENQVKDILEELLQRFEQRQALTENYEARLKSHNQRQLFDLKTILPNFEIDDEMYDALTFRETLLIHNYKYEDDPNPITVGGLCLDIQKAEGRQVANRKELTIDERIQRVLKTDENETKDPNKTPEENAKAAESTEEELPELEDDLETQIRRSTSKFLIHVSSQFDIMGHNAGSRITAWVDRNLHTLEEMRREYFIEAFGEEKKILQKTLYCGLVKRCYYVKHTSTVEEIEDRKFYSLGKAKNLILEGSNFLLLRYLALTRYIGTFELAAMYINGDMCRNIYSSAGPESTFVNNTKLDICKVYRTIIEQCGVEHYCCTVLTLQGQIIKQEWEGVHYGLAVNPLAIVKNEKPIGNEQILLKDSWEKDMQLMSKYLDEKLNSSMKIKSYLLDHPEFRHMISDYVQAILLMKPQDILDFTIRHFLSFAPEYVEDNEYFY